MEFWAEFRARSSGKEFVAGGFGGMAGVIAGYPLDTLRVEQQHSRSGGSSAIRILGQLVAREGYRGLFKGMGAPLASVSFQNAIVFQSYATLSRIFDKSVDPNDPPSFKGVILGGLGAGALQTLIISPIELVKIQLQLQKQTKDTSSAKGPADVARFLVNREGLKGIYRGFQVTVLRDVPSHAFYFLTYEYMREKLHPGCRKNGQESYGTMLVAGGLAGVASWISCYPLDVVKTRIQAQSNSTPFRYRGIVDCFRRSVKNEGYNVLCRGLGTTLIRAFIVNGAVFIGYETALRFLFTKNR